MKRVIIEFKFWWNRIKWLTKHYMPKFAKCSDCKKYRHIYSKYHNICLPCYLDAAAEYWDDEEFLNN